MVETQKDIKDPAGSYSRFVCNVSRGPLTKVSTSAMRKHLANDIAEAGEGTSSRVLRRMRVDEVIGRVKQDPGLDGHGQGLFGCIVDLDKFVR